MSFRLKATSLLLAVGGLILLQACGETTTTTTTTNPPFATPAATDRMWELVPPPVPSSLEPVLNVAQYTYIRTQDAADGKVRMFDPCTYKITGDAVKVGDTYELRFKEASDADTWIAKFTGGKLEFKLKSTGALQYTGTRRDLSYTCDSNKKPTDLKPYAGTGEGVFAITCTAEQTGCKHIQAAANQLLPDLNLVAAQIKAEFAKTAASPPPSTSTPEPTPEGIQTLICSSSGTATTDGKTNEEMTLLASNPYIYPGSMIRGAFFAAGSIAPVTVLRSGGQIVLSSVVLPPGVTYTKTVDEVSQASIQAAVSSLVNDNPIVGQVAIGTSTLSTVNSSSTLMFNAGLDVRFPQGEVTSKFQLDTTSTQNSVMMKVTQIFYYIDFKDPVGPFDLFKDGINLVDNGDQIGVKEATISTGAKAPMDPPLYVKRVGYGRQIIVVAKSSSSSKDLMLALTGSYKTAGGIEIEGNTKTTYNNTLKNSEVSAFVYGGSAAEAFKVLGGKGTDDMFDRVRALLVEGSTVSKTNPGAPVTYQLNYVTNQTPAAMGFATTYYKRDCVSVPPTFAAYSLNIEGLDRAAWKFNVDKNDGRGFVTVLSGVNTGNYKLVSPTYIPGDTNDYKVQVEIDNQNCFHTNARFQMTRYQDGKTDKEIDVGVGTGAGWCNIPVGRFTFIINRGDGKLDLSDSCESQYGC